MRIIKLPSAVVSERKEIRRRNLKKNKNAYKALQEMMVPAELSLSMFRKYYHSVLSTKEKQILIDMGMDPWSVEGIKYVGDCKRFHVELGSEIQDDN